MGKRGRYRQKIGGGGGGDIAFEENRVGRLDVAVVGSQGGGSCQKPFGSWSKKEK